MDIKAIRKQIRNVVQEMLPTILGNVVTETLTTKLAADVKSHINERCDAIEKYCKDNLTVQDKRAKAVQGYLIKEVKTDIQNRMGDMDVTIEAIIAVLADSGIVIDEFVEKVNAKKPLIVSQRETEAKANMSSELEKRTLEAEQAQSQTA